MKRRCTPLLGLLLAWMILASPMMASVLYVGLTDQSFNGVALFTSNLGLINQVQVAGPLTSVAAGPTGTFYTGAGNTVRQHNNDGSVIHTVSGSATTTLPTMAFSGSQLFVGVRDQSFEGAARFTSNLGLLDQMGIDLGVAAIADGLNNTFFVANGNTILQMDTAGNILRNISGSATTIISDLSFIDNILYVGLADQNFNGVALFTAGLGLINQIQVGEFVDALAGGPSGTFYVGSGRQVLQYDQAGNVLRSISGSATTQIVDLDFAADAEAPEPGTVVLFSAGLVLLGVGRFRRRT